MKTIFIVDKLCLYYQLDKKGELAEKLGIKPSVLSNWITRNTIDWNIIFTKCEEINLNWLIYDEGPMSRNISNDSIQENATIYKELLEKQKDEIKELNREIGKLQLTVEQLKKGDQAASWSLAAEPKLGEYKPKSSTKGA